MIPTRTTAFKIAICIIDSSIHLSIYIHLLPTCPQTNVLINCPHNRPTDLLTPLSTFVLSIFNSQVFFLHSYFPFALFCSLLHFFSAEHWSKAGACGAPVFYVSFATLCWPLSFLVFFCVFHSALISFCVWAVFSVVPELDGGLFLVFA